MICAWARERREKGEQSCKTKKGLCFYTARNLVEYRLVILQISIKMKCMLGSLGAMCAQN